MINKAIGWNKVLIYRSLLFVLILVFFAFGIFIGCRKTDRYECEKAHQIEYDQVIVSPGVYNVQGWTGFTLRICVDWQGFLVYSCSDLIRVDGKTRRSAEGAELAASRIKASDKWGMLWTEQGLWIYSVSSGAFNWSSVDGIGGRYHCRVVSDPSAKTGYSDSGIKTVYDSVVNPQTNEWTNRKAEFRPYPHGYPQVIQSDDYETIQAIEVLHSLLEKTGSDNTASVKLSENSIRFGGVSGKTSDLEVTDDMIKIGDEMNKDKNVVILYNTLLKILNSISKDSACTGVEFYQHRTRVYLKRTTITFFYPSVTVVLDSYSNGPENDEKLYVLDIEKNDRE